MSSLEKKKTIIKFIIKKDYFVKSRKNNIKEHYEFERILGKGAFGTVYQARANFFPHETRAIKVINKEKVKNHQSLIDQVTILKQLDHPSIIKIYQTYQNDKHLCIVLDYCQGGQLYERMARNGSFSQNQARIVFIQMAKVVKFLHSSQIVHRDLKLQNFLMHKKDSLDIKLIDFGLSKTWKQSLRNQLFQTGQNKLVGTIYYMAPQVVAKNYDERCDIWSLGVLLYIMVTGLPPFDGADDKQILTKIQSLSYTFDCPQMKRVSAELKDLISKILVPEDQRLSIDQIMEHPWIKKEQSTKPIEINFKRMKQFSTFSRMKKVVMTYIASQLPQGRIHELGQIFKQVDKDNNGLLTTQEIKKCLQSQNNNVSYQQLMQILSQTDTDQNGKINYNELIAASLQANVYNNEKYLARVFEYFDTNKDGTLCCNEFKEILACTGVRYIESAEIDEIIKDADVNNDGCIDYKEFLNNMRSRGQKESQIR